jgi:hypothetical protein
MKIATLFVSLLLIACTSKDITPSEIVGKWAPSYMIQTKNADSTWGDWTTINIFIASPVIEFTSDGRYLTNGQPGANCCYAGNKFSISGNTINFMEQLSCPNISCVTNSGWIIYSLKDDTLILEISNIRSKFTKSK